MRKPWKTRKSYKVWGMILKKMKKNGESLLTIPDKLSIIEPVKFHPLSRVAEGTAR